jgi:pilus assembly protein Flp/PilA
MLFAAKEQGQGLVEYAIILVLVALVVIAVVRLLGPKIGDTFSSINSSL